MGTYNKHINVHSPPNPWQCQEEYSRACSLEMPTWRGAWLGRDQQLGRGRTSRCSGCRDPPLWSAGGSSLVRGVEHRVKERRQRNNSEHLIVNEKVADWHKFQLRRSSYIHVLYLVMTATERAKLVRTTYHCQKAAKLQDTGPYTLCREGRCSQTCWA